MNPQNTQLLFNWEIGTASNVDIFTVPVGKAYYVTSIHYQVVTGNSGITTNSRVTSLTSGCSTKFQFAFLWSTQSPTVTSEPTTQSFPVPIKFTAGEKLQVQATTTNFTVFGGVSIIEVTI